MKPMTRPGMYARKSGITQAMTGGKCGLELVSPWPGYPYGDRYPRKREDSRESRSGWLDEARRRAISAASDRPGHDDVYRGLGSRGLRRRPTHRRPTVVDMTSLLLGLPCRA